MFKKKKTPKPQRSKKSIECIEEPNNNWPWARDDSRCPITESLISYVAGFWHLSNALEDTEELEAKKWLDIRCEFYTWVWYRAGLWTVTDKTRIRDSGIQVVKGTVVQSCLTLCNLMDSSTPDSSVLHCLPDFAQIHVPWNSDAI